ncbi:hypothetical protein Celaphus_00017039, partial [Cervus elaphus hippelaphus]
VRHRWCELIVKHKYTKAYRDVERFLQEDQKLPGFDGAVAHCRYQIKHGQTSLHL